MKYAHVNERRKNDPNFMKAAMQWEEQCQSSAEEQKIGDLTFGGYIKDSVRLIKRWQWLAGSSLETKSSQERFILQTRRELRNLHFQAEHDRHIGSCMEPEHTCGISRYFRSACRLCGVSFTVCGGKETIADYCIDCLLLQHWQIPEEESK